MVHKHQEENRVQTFCGMSEKNKLPSGFIKYTFFIKFFCKLEVERPHHVINILISFITFVDILTY